MILIKLYGPLLTAVVLFVAALRVKLEDKTLFKLRPPMLEVAIPITSKILCRAIFASIALGCLYYYLVLDFSRFFPDRFEMEVFYDEPGLRQNLAAFSDEELASMGYSPEKFQLREVYYQNLDKKLKDILRYDGFFSLSEGIVHSGGETSFKVQKSSGFHKYCVSESKGELTHTLERSNAASVSFKSFFERLPTSYDYIRPSFSDVVLKRQLILQPRFKQIIAENYRSDGIMFDHTVVGITKVRLFPVPTFNSTIYFADFKEEGIIPVAYAVYKY